LRACHARRSSWRSASETRCATRASLDKFKVPEGEQRELFAIVESTKKDIVTAATQTRR
jgi:hypothetical protein